MREKWTEGVSLFINAEPADGIDYYDIWHNGGPGGPMLVAHHENSARAICDAIEELHELRAEVERLRDAECLADARVAEMHDVAMLRERDSVVAWLEKAGWMPSMIEVFRRGEHRHEEKP